jgi:glycosyl transferase family 87
MERAASTHLVGRLLVELPQPVLRLIRIGLALGWVYHGLIGLILPIAWLVVVVGHLRDVLAVYVVSWAIRDGIDPSLPLNVLAQQYVGALPYRVYAHPTPHPPTLALLAMPFTLFRYDVAEVVWLGLQLLCLFGSVYLLGRALDVPWGLRTIALLAFGLIGWNPIMEDLAYGNLNVMLLICFMAVWLLLKRESQGWAGVVLGLSLLIKPIAWPIGVLLLLRGRWRTLVFAGLMVSVGYGMALWAMGSEHFANFVMRGMPSTVRLYQDISRNQSLWSLTRQKVWNDEVFYTNPYLLAPASSEYVSMILSGIVPLLALVVVALLMRRATLDWAYAAFVCLSIVASPIAWYQYVAFSIIPVAIILNSVANEGFPTFRTARILGVVALLGISIEYWLKLAAQASVSPARPVSPLVPISLLPNLLAYMPLVAIVLLTIVVVLERRRGSAPAVVDVVGR